MSWATQYFGATLHTKSGNVDTATALAGKKRVGIYFSAHWCPPCRGFTPVLAEFYSEIKENDADDLEIIFVSSDKNQAAFQEYYDEMPWISLPFSDRVLAQSLGSRFGVRGIPNLIILNGETGDIKDGNGRETVMSVRGDVSKALKRW